MVYFSNVLPMNLSLHKIPSYFTISVVGFLCGFKRIGFVEVRVDESDARFLHKSNQRFLGDVSNLAHFPLVFLPLVFVFIVFSSFAECFLSLCKRHMTKWSTEYTTIYLVSTVITICTTKKHSTFKSQSQCEC